MSSVLHDVTAFVKDPEAHRLFLQERTILELTEEIYRLMEEQNITQAEMARRIGRTKGQVSQMLSGGRNLTLRSVSDLLWAMGRSLEAVTRPVEDPPGRYVRIPDGGDWDAERRIEWNRSRSWNVRFGKGLPNRPTRGAA